MGDRHPALPVNGPGIAALQAGARVAQRGETDFITRYVIGPGAAVRLAHEEAVIRGEHQLPAPALLRSQVLSFLYQAVRRGR